MKIKLFGIWLLSLVLLGGGTAWSMEDQKTPRMVAHIHPRASLSLDRTLVTFEGYEDQSVIRAQEGPLQVIVKGRASSSRPPDPDYAGRIRFGELYRSYPHTAGAMDSTRQWLEKWNIEPRP
jgi:hypothetical protein